MPAASVNIAGQRWTGKKKGRRNGAKNGAPGRLSYAESFALVFPAIQFSKRKQLAK